MYYIASVYYLKIAEIISEGIIIVPTKIKYLCLINTYACNSTYFDFRGKHIS